MSKYHLPEGMPIPVPENDDLSKPYWEGLRESKLMVQKCQVCGTYVRGPEWICHQCRSFDLAWEEVVEKGRIYSWERVWHPVHPALKGYGPNIVVLIQLPEAQNIRMIGNLLGDPEQKVPIGTEVEVVFEHHNDANPAYSLAHWRSV